MEGRVHSLETFGLVDGPGVRFVVFLQGCRMRCKYCHNPETWSLEGGELWSAKDLFDRAYRYKPYWMRNGQLNGGITVSGGEPLLQIDFLIEFFKYAKEKGYGFIKQDGKEDIFIHYSNINKFGYKTLVIELIDS